MVRVIANILIWLQLTAEVEGGTYINKWSPPLMTLGTFLFRPMFSIVPWDVLVLSTLAAAWQQRSMKARVPVFMKSVKLAFGVLGGAWIWGVLMGGSAYQTYFQLRPYVMGLFVTMLVGATCQTISHVRALGKVVMWACLYRSCMCILFYVTVVVDLPYDPPYLTDHFDSALFVTGWFVVICFVVSAQTWKSLVWLMVASVPIIAAIVLNNRRLAWACAGASLALVYLVAENTKAKKKLTRLMVLASPLIIAYVAAGWSNPTGIFKPVGSISSMFGENQDDSSKMRDIENHNLLVTLRTNPLLGYGWGKEYIEQMSAISIADMFPQYRYLPHNSLLALIAFSGAVGLWGYGQLLAVAGFLHAKVYRGTQNVVAKAAALSSLVGMLVSLLMAWGDLGFNSPMINVLLAVCVGVAECTPVATGVWPKPGSTAPPPPVAAPARPT